MCPQIGRQFRPSRISEKRFLMRLEVNNEWESLWAEIWQMVQTSQTMTTSSLPPLSSYHMNYMNGSPAPPMQPMVNHSTIGSTPSAVTTAQHMANGSTPTDSLVLSSMVCPTMASLQSQPSLTSPLEQPMNAALRAQSFQTCSEQTNNSCEPMVNHKQCVSVITANGVEQQTTQFATAFQIRLLLACHTNK
ncbi:unnamed protein product, partial [Medioppia subpectinata]